MTGLKSQTQKSGGEFKIGLLNGNSVSSARKYQEFLITEHSIIGDKAKEAKERQDREAENRSYANQTYQTPNPSLEEDDLFGLPWGSLSLRHVVTKGRAREEESRWGIFGFGRDEDHRYYEHSVNQYKPDVSSFYESDAYYEYGGSNSYYTKDEYSIDDEGYVDKLEEVVDESRPTEYPEGNEKERLDEGSASRGGPIPISGRLDPDEIITQMEASTSGLDPSVVFSSLVRRLVSVRNLPKHQKRLLWTCVRTKPPIMLF